MSSQDRRQRQVDALTQLLILMENLRDPEHGCAWDRKQTLQSLTRHTLEEVYEVIDAVDTGSPAHIRDELGDLLFQVVFYARIAEESEQFDIADIADAIRQKLLHRHPHLFPDGTLESFGQPGSLTAEQVEKNWEQIKNAERAAIGSVSVMDDVARAMPALERAGKLQKRAASVGFDWAQVGDVLSKLEEETEELYDAIERGNSAACHHELGDLLFTCVNLARHLGMDAEGALRRANQRFEQRFRYIENKASAQSTELSQQSPQQLELWWQEAKSNLSE